ncbi:MAG: alpha/beta hydrolase [Sphingobacteriaceae bacterium]|nr:alpha/beta hydrolase [Sphingobacteriaceae bacterium]
MKSKNVFNGINYYFNDLKKHNALVLIHGNSLDSTIFTKQFEGLKNIPLVAIDLPGHGLSNRANNFESAYCLPGYIDAVKSIIDHLELDNIILAGHSLGGHVAIEAANEMNSVQGMMIFGTPPIGMPPQMDKMFDPNPAMGNLFSPEISEENAKLLAKEFVYNSKELESKYATMISATDGNARENLGASIGKGQFKNEIEIVAKSKMPIAVINGDKDAFVNKKYINELTIGNLWNGQKIWIKDAGHIPQEEKPQEFNSIVMKFYDHVFT